MQGATPPPLSPPLPKPFPSQEKTLLFLLVLLTIPFLLMDIITTFTPQKKE
jgi:hypothetical protein